MIDNIKNKIIDICIKNKNGFTYTIDIKPTKHKKGFYIGVTDNSNKNLKIAINNLLKIYEKDFKHIDNKNLYIGGWCDNNTKKFYLDLSVYVKNLKNALLVAKLFKQKAIYDINKQNCIYLNN